MNASKMSPVLSSIMCWRCGDYFYVYRVQGELLSKPFHCQYCETNLEPNSLREAAAAGE
jgi:hypothetical protein